jgi:hypothetical protein
MRRGNEPVRPSSFFAPGVDLDRGTALARGGDFLDRPEQRADESRAAD